MASRMERDNKERREWRRVIALIVAAACVLAALVAQRGPDQIVSPAADAAGFWLLSGPAFWNTQSIFGAVVVPLYAVTGPRGWQNLHVGLLWLTVLLWLVPLKPSAWRGMIPLVPALAATSVAVPDNGLSGLGLATVVLSAWRCFTFARNNAALAFPAAAWLAVWLSPAALPLLAALAAEGSTRWSRAKTFATASVALLVINLTPRGFSIWGEAWTYLRWSPNATPSGPTLAALLLGLVALLLASRRCLAQQGLGSVLAPALLLICASRGQTAYLWMFALMTIPLWAPAKEQLQQLGLNVKWWMVTALVATAASLVVWSGMERVNDWYNLAMVPEAVLPSLTKAALPKEGLIYINPRGLAKARFAGSLPARAEDGETSRLGREPRLWRAQDRRVRYRAVWLLGDKADHAPLARHLGESPDWRLAAVDAAGLLFVRDGARKEFATEPAQHLASGMVGAANRSRFLAGAALSCLSAQAIQEAGELSQTSVRKSDLASDSAAARALVLISLARIDEAVEQSGRAVDLTPRSSSAWQARAETLLHAGLIDDAYAAAQRGAELAPGDEGALWLAARAANAARAFQAEAEILEQLIAMTSGRGGDDSFYQLYLGQSYAKQGLARPALRALEKAAAAPGLSEEQRKELQEEIVRVRESAEHN